MQSLRAKKGNEQQAVALPRGVIMNILMKRYLQVPVSLSLEHPRYGLMKLSSSFRKPQNYVR